MGRKFKASWGPGLTLVSLSSHEQSSTIPLVNKISQIDNYVCGRMIDDKTSTNIVQRIQILGGKSTSTDYIKLFSDSIEEHLKIQLKYCIIDNDKSICPLIRPANGNSGILSLHEHCNLSIDIADSGNADRLSMYASDVWQLCTALWGSLPDIDTDKNSECHDNVMVRRDAFSEWLKYVVENTHQDEIKKINNDDELILSLLSANKLEEACELSRKIGDYTLALLISQISGYSSVKELIKQTIGLWQATDVINNISLCRLKIYMLVAGEHLINFNNDIINVCESFDWKRSLAIHLWYLSSPTASITDVIELYDASFNIESDDIYAAPPLPDYKDEEFEPILNGKIKTYDLCYHLLKLYSTGNHSLEELLNPMTHTSDPLDYRLTWLLQQTIIGLGYSHLSDHVSSMTHTNFSSQLEAANLWHWSIFVVLHLNDSSIRKKAILDLLSRHVEIDDNDDYADREKFLIDELGIPSMWINEAKAIKSCAMKRYSEAAWYYLQAQHWNKAHEIIIEHIAADAIINENYYYLKSLLIPLVSDECHSVINGWSYQGQLLWEYMEIVGEIEEFLKNTDYSKIGYKLELLQPQLTSLCTKINQFPCPTAKLRLCQAEIAKRTLHLARSLLMLQSHEDISIARVLVQLVSQLPLPEDYAQQELRPILNMCINEISGH